MDSRKNTLDWVNSYLSDRAQSVYINGSFSFPLSIKCGVPQGSCLGPLLYLISMNDISCALIQSQATIFADDTTVHVPGYSNIDIQILLQQDLEKNLRMD